MAAYVLYPWDAAGSFSQTLQYEEREYTSVASALTQKGTCSPAPRGQRVKADRGGEWRRLELQDVQSSSQMINTDKPTLWPVFYRPGVLPVTR